jgi:glutamine cyclotransferase
VEYRRLEEIRRLPHPARGFTQGLILDGDTIWESTGQYGRSTLRRYRLGAGELDWCAPLPPELFGEGICRAGDRIWQLTWRERVALCWDARDGRLAGRISYNREGWGICAAEDAVLTSDGSSELVRRDPADLRPVDVIQVRYAGRRLPGLNDLHWQSGTVWANVFPTRCLVGIDPAGGEVISLVDARAAEAGEPGHRHPEAVLNGITSLPASDELLLTGKGWQWLHQVRLAADRPRRRTERLLTGAG